MCGIAGGYAFTEQGKKYTGKIAEATTCIKHRGPDGGNVYENDAVVLGHRRLSIIDVSAAANQPMISNDGRFVIIFNGEIFNYKELNSKYLADEHFITSSDTEVFLKLFMKMGTKSFKELRGFFAAAIYNIETKKLYIVRDRVGKKPVHYYQDEDVLLFGSELKSLISFGIKKELNHQVLPFYFQLNYLPQPLSFLKKVQKLKPGHYLKIAGKEVEEIAYYKGSIHKDRYNQFSYSEAKTKLIDLMDEATRLRLISDVPLGAFLSGGIDSSVVVALASRHQQHLKTFSVGYKDHPFFDETAYAESVAKKYKTEHTVFKLGNDDFLEHIDAVLESIDEPFADSSAIPTYILCKHTRKHVTVALSGDGGDEVFAGYNKHNAELNAMTPSFKKAIVQGFQPLWKLLPKSRNNKITNKVRQLNRFAEAASLSSEDRYWQWASIMPAEASRKLFINKVFQSFNGKNSLNKYFDLNVSGNDFNEILLADMNVVLVGDMLVKVDMMSMANSLEIRSPFLDSEVVDFSFGLPSEYKIDGKMKKRIVQDAFRHLLPVELYNRPKQGFDIPLLGWFRKELWSKINDDLLSDSFIKEQELFDLQSIQSLKKKLHTNNPEDSHETIWALIVFQHWWKKYFS
jgi:asparagine synthase (glutamine-hydrolysing)